MKDTSNPQINSSLKTDTTKNLSQAVPPLSPSQSQSKGKEVVPAKKSAADAPNETTKETESATREYTCVSSDQVKTEVKQKIAKLFPDSSLVSVGAFLRTCMSAKDKDGCYQRGVKPSYLENTGSFEKVVSFRSRLLIDILKESKEKGLEAVTTDEEAIALAQRLLASNSPVYVFPHQSANTLSATPLIQRHSVFISNEHPGHISSLCSLFRRCELDRGKDGKEKTRKHQEPKDLFKNPNDGYDVVRISMPVKGKAPVYELGGEKRETARYYWVYEGSSHWKLGVIAVIVVSLQMYQLWPMWARTGVWYMSTTALLFILGVCVLQLILFILVWPSGYDFWLLPNFTSEEAPIWLLFTPFYTFEKSKHTSTLLRCATVVMIGASVYTLASVDPSDFSEFLASQGKLVEDLYAGNLLSDGKDGTGLVADTGRFVNPMNPFGSKWGPGRYMGKFRNAPSLEELSKEEENTAEASVVDDVVGGVEGEQGANEPPPTPSNEEGQAGV